ncbi:hypothetical protein RhoFasSB10_03656 [Rhodococcus fascians]|uniref:hypothetical protein n=1 Tax=Rhodococcoides fascians TaxID=1828 RepID=UPI00169CD618|nr:hypothetical protein [Rhodococcus fascians]
MSKTQKLHGTWWTTTDPASTVHGVLTVGDGVSPQLAVFDALIDLRADEYVTVHGQSGGRAVTMFEARVVDHNQTFEDVGAGQRPLRHITQTLQGLGGRGRGLPRQLN